MVRPSVANDRRRPREQEEGRAWGPSPRALVSAKAWEDAASHVGQHPHRQPNVLHGEPLLRGVHLLKELLTEAAALSLSSMAYM